MADEQLWNKIRKGEVDPNHQELFFLAMIKALIYDLNKNLKVRGEYVPHFIVNTGDDTMYLMVKGQNQALEPLETTNEQFVYSCVPRCIVTTAGITIPTDQLTSPYSYGGYQLEYDGQLNSMVAEFRRIPIEMSVSLKYYLDTFTDALEIAQEIITKMAFINMYKFVYMGQVIPASYTMPDSQDIEKNLEFDGLSTDSKTRNVSLDLKCESTLPVFYEATSIPSDKIINLYYTEGDPMRRTHAVGPRAEYDGDGTVVIQNIPKKDDENA